MPSTVIDARGVVCRHGDRTVLPTFDLRVATDDRIGLIGDNGSGKSSLMRVLAGLDPPADGTVRRRGTVGHVPQLGRHLPDDRTVRDAVAASHGVAGAARELERAEAALADGHDPDAAIVRHAAALEDWMRVGGHTFDGDLSAASTRLAFPPALLDRPASTLSAGQGARARLLTIAVRPHDVLLLDEPTNHLDAAGREILGQLLSEHRGALVLASHDRDLLAAHAERVVELDPRGGPARVFAGGWHAYERERAAARARTEQAYEQAVRRRTELESAERELRRRAAATRSRMTTTRRDPDKFMPHWVAQRSDAVATRGRMVGARAARIEVPSAPWRDRPLALQLTAAERSAAHVVALEGAVIQRGGWRLPPIDLAISVGERILLQGPNGAGKSTLLEALAGTHPLAAGTRRSGPTAVISVLGAIEEALGGTEPVDAAMARLSQVSLEQARGQLARLGLDPEVVGRPGHTLSPGERTRAELAVLGARRTTCLLLDEPSNHLDLRSLAAMEAALEAWPGALVVATHDERLATRLGTTRTVDLTGSDA